MKYLLRLVFLLLAPFLLMVLFTPVRPVYACLCGVSEQCDIYFGYCYYVCASCPAGGGDTSSGGSSSGDFSSSGGGGCEPNCQSPGCTHDYCSNAYLDTSNPPNLYLVGIMGGTYPEVDFWACDASIYGGDNCVWLMDHGVAPPPIKYTFPPANGSYSGPASNLYYQYNDGTQDGCGAHGGVCRMPIPSSAFTPTAGHAYVWQMKIGSTGWWCAGGTSCTGSPSCFNGASPDVPQLSSPGNGSATSGISPQTLSWHGISGWGISCNPSDNFTVYFDTSPNPTTVLCTVGSGTTSCPTGSLNPSTTYYWKVVANNGSTISTSAVWSLLTTTSIYGWVYNGAYQGGGNRSNVQNNSLIPNYTVNLSGTSNATTTTSGTAITGILGNYLFSNLLNNSTYNVQLAVTPTGSALSGGRMNPQAVAVAGAAGIADFPFVTVTPTPGPGTPTPTPIFAPIPTNTPTPTPNPLTPTVQPTPTPIKPTPSVCIPLPTPVLQLPAHQLCTNAKPTFSAYVSDPNGENVWAHFYSHDYETFDRLGTSVLPPYPTGTNSQYSSDSYMLNSTGGYWWTAYTQNSATTCSKSADAPAWLVTMDYVPPPKPTAPNCTLQSQSLLSGACTFNCSWPADPKVNPACADTNDYHPIFWTTPDNSGWDRGWIGNQLSTNVVTASDGQLLYSQIAARDNIGNVSALSDTGGPFTCPNIDFSVTPTPIPAPLDDGLISHWKFDEGSGSVAHDSTGSNDGTIHGASWTTGWCGDALRYNGLNNFVSVPTTFGLGNANATITAWVNIPSLSDIGTFVKIGGYMFGFGVGNGTLDAGDGSPGNNLIMIFDGVRWIDTGKAIGLGWHQVAMVLDSSGTPSAYIDGKPIGSFSGQNAIVSGSGTGFGGYYGGGRWFTGDIDEVRVYSRALSDSDIQTLYNYDSTCALSPTNTPTPVVATPTITPTPTPGDWIQVQGGDTYQQSYNYPVPINQNFITNLPGDLYNRGVAWSGLSSWNFGFGNSDYKKVGTSLSNTYNFTYFVESLKSKSIAVPNTLFVGRSSDLDNSHSIYSYSGLGYYTLDSTFWKHGMKPETPVTIFLISGSLEITKDFSFSPDAIDDTVVFVVNGNIYVDSGVNEIPGLYISSQAFSVALGQNTFTLDGMVYANTFSLKRIVKSPTIPTYTFIYQPQYMIALLPYLGRPQVNWQEVKP